MTTPGSEVVERHGRCTSNYAIKVLWEHLYFLHTLSASSRATEIVTFVVCPIVECFCDVLTEHYTGMQCAVCEILDHSWVVKEGYSAHSVVAVVSTDCSKS